MKLSVSVAIFLLIVGPCVGCTSGDVRLTHHPNGTLQICESNEWKFVCSQNWGHFGAAVACRQLGYDGGYTQSTLIQSSNAVAVDPITYHCNGRENKLQNCENSSYHSCSQGVAIVCVHRNVSDPCRSGDIRLWGGQTEYEGNIEICSDHGVWSAVCDYHWQNAEAVVACRQLGYTDNVAIPYERSAFGQRIQPMEFGGLTCRGNESSLQECTVSQSNVKAWSRLILCDSRDYSAVKCIPRPGTCTNGDVRLTNGYSHNNGFVEICIEGIWIGACFDSYYSNWETYGHICNQLGYPRSTGIDQEFFPSNRSEPQAWTYLYWCRAESSVLNCVRNTSFYGVRYISSCDEHFNRANGILCCPNDTAMCSFQPRSRMDPTTPPPTTQPIPSIQDEDKAEFLLHFGTAATSVIMTGLADLRGLEEDIQKRIMDDILDECDCPFHTSALEGGFFSFGESVTYHSKVLGVDGKLAVSLATILKVSFEKDPLIQYHSANTYLAATFVY